MIDINLGRQTAVVYITRQEDELVSYKEVGHLSQKLVPLIEYTTHSVSYIHYTGFLFIGHSVQKTVTAKSLDSSRNNHLFFSRV